MPRLVSFPNSSLPLPEIQITGSCTEMGSAPGRLLFRFEVLGRLDQLRLPSALPPDRPRRKDELWKHACMEAFVQPAGELGYWEVNLSPSGDWNVYRFTDYRQGMAPELAIPSLEVQCSRTATSLALSCEVDLPLSPGFRSLRIGLTAVIEDTSERITYWALRHSSEQPDFHLPANFALELPR